MYNYIKSPK